MESMAMKYNLPQATISGLEMGQDERVGERRQALREGLPEQTPSFFCLNPNLVGLSHKFNSSNSFSFIMEGIWKFHTAWRVVQKMSESRAWWELTELKPWSKWAIRQISKTSQTVERDVMKPTSERVTTEPKKNLESSGLGNPCFVSLRLQKQIWGEPWRTGLTIAWWAVPKYSTSEIKLISEYIM